MATAAELDMLLVLWTRVLDVESSQLPQVDVII